MFGARAATQNAGRMVCRSLRTSKPTERSQIYFMSMLKIDKMHNRKIHFLIDWEPCTNHTKS